MVMFGKFLSIKEQFVWAQFITTWEWGESWGINSVGSLFFAQNLMFGKFLSIKEQFVWTRHITAWQWGEWWSINSVEPVTSRTT